MDKRTKQKKKQHDAFRNKLKKVFALFFCIALLIFSISITDTSTRRMIMCDDEKYAMAVSFQNDGMIRFDIAGEKILVNIEPVKRAVFHVVSYLKRCCKSL